MQPSNEGVTKLPLEWMVVISWKKKLFYYALTREWFFSSFFSFKGSLKNFPRLARFILTRVSIRSKDELTKKNLVRRLYAVFVRDNSRPEVVR